MSRTPALTPRKLPTEVRQPYPAHWVVTYQIELLGKPVEPGTVLKIRDDRGTYRFVRHVRNPRVTMIIRLDGSTESWPDGVEWIDVVGGPKDCDAWCAFRPTEVVKVLGKPKEKPKAK